jgi:electron transfer flavoprotein beta subunit
MRGIMAARTKPLEVIEPASVEALTQVVKFTLPPAKASCKYVDAANPAELIKLLSEEAKAL